MKYINILLLLLLFGCSQLPRPIEVFKGKGYVITDITKDHRDNIQLQVKNTETIKYITILPFDAKGLQVGDTIK